MTTQEKRNLIFFFGGAGILVLVLIFGTSALLKLIPGTPASAPGSLPDIGAKTSITNQGAGDPRAILYRSAGFSVPEVTIRSTDAIGCLITVINETDSSVDIGVSPHRGTAHPGADTPPISPGASMVLDPRYPGLEGVSYHSHTDPSSEFFVRYGEGCR